MIKRQRGRGRSPGQKPQNNNPNRAYESNGPDLKVRGSAQTVFEKYQQLGRDCQSSGDRVLGENYMQHAEHYFRVLRAMQPTFVPRSELMIAGYEDEYEDGDESGVLLEGGENEISDGVNAIAQPEFQQNRAPRDNRERDIREREPRDNRDRDRGQREFRDNREPRESREPRDTNEPRVEGEEGRFGRRRRRPDRPERFGNDGGAVQQNGEVQGEQAPPRPDYRSEGRTDNRGEVRPNYRDSRPNYREDPRGDNRGEVQNGAPPAARAETFDQPEFIEPIGFSNPQEIIVTPEDAAPARERRPRPPRAPRAPREAPASVPETGFGNELPAFLATPIPVVPSE